MIKVYAVLLSHSLGLIKKKSVWKLTCKISREICEINPKIRMNPRKKGSNGHKFINLSSSSSSARP